MEHREPAACNTYRVKIKICGITNLDDALFTQSVKPDALGFVFYTGSPRFIDPRKCRLISARLASSIKKVGVFVNQKRGDVIEIAKLCALDMLQFHGEESPRYCAGFSGYKVIKAFRVKNKKSLESIARYSVDYYLFDAFAADSKGGSGRRFDWRLLDGAGILKPFFISGGLNAGNVGKAIKSLRPRWVDVSSGVESSPGEKDHVLVKQFIERVKAYEC